MKKAAFAILWGVLLGGLPLPDWVWPCSQLPFIPDSGRTRSGVGLIQRKGFPLVYREPSLLHWGGRKESEGWDALSS